MMAPALLALCGQPTLSRGQWPGSTRPLAAATGARCLDAAWMRSVPRVAVRPYGLAHESNGPRLRVPAILRGRTVAMVALCFGYDDHEQREGTGDAEAQ
jgi:hypothetical protein